MKIIMLYYFYSLAISHVATYFIFEISTAYIDVCNLSATRKP